MYIYMVMYVCGKYINLETYVLKIYGCIDKAFSRSRTEQSTSTPPDIGPGAALCSRRSETISGWPTPPLKKERAGERERERGRGLI